MSNVRFSSCWNGLRLSPLGIGVAKQRVSKRTRVAWTLIVVGAQRRRLEAVGETVQRGGIGDVKVGRC